MKLTINELRKILRETVDPETLDVAVASLSRISDKEIRTSATRRMLDFLNQSAPNAKDADFRARFATTAALNKAALDPFSPRGQLEPSDVGGLQAKGPEEPPRAQLEPSDVGGLQSKGPGGPPPLPSAGSSSPFADPEDVASVGKKAKPKKIKPPDLTLPGKSSPKGGTRPSGAPELPSKGKPSTLLPKTRKEKEAEMPFADPEDVEWDTGGPPSRSPRSGPPSLPKSRGKPPGLDLTKMLGMSPKEREKSGLSRGEKKPQPKAKTRPVSAPRVSPQGEPIRKGKTVPPKKPGMFRRAGKAMKKKLDPKAYFDQPGMEGVMPSLKSLIREKKK